MTWEPAVSNCFTVPTTTATSARGREQRRCKLGHGLCLLDCTARLTRRLRGRWRLAVTSGGASASAPSVTHCRCVQPSGEPSPTEGGSTAQCAYTPHTVSGRSVPTRTGAWQHELGAWWRVKQQVCLLPVHGACAWCLCMALFVGFGGLACTVGQQLAICAHTVL